MARIRTIKPEFFRHEDLFEAEKETNFPLRVAFAGLWTAADREGRFCWSPRQLKLDCLPFDDLDFSRVLDALWTRGFIEKYTSQNKEYGFIPSWSRHQVINNRERPSSLPIPNENNILTRDGRVMDAWTTPLNPFPVEGKGRERKGNIDDDASAKASKTGFLTQEAIDLSDRVAVLMKFNPKEIPPSWCGAAYKVQAWLSAGWQADLIYAAIEKQAAARNGPPSTIKYFEKGIADFIAQQSAPLPEGNQNATSANGESGDRTKINGNHYSARRTRGQTRDDVILAGMGRIADRLARDGQNRQSNDLLPDERIAETDGARAVNHRSS